MQNLTLTIIVPIFNVEEYLEQCLQSLIENDYIGKYEVLLIDDCGKDLSLQISEQYIKKYPDIFKLIKHKINSGISAARNTGLAQTKSPYVMFVDSDDWLSAKIIPQLLNVLDKYSPDFLFFDFTREWENRSKDMLFLTNVENNKIITQELYFSLIQKIPVTAWGKVFKTDIAKAHLFTPGIIFEDVAIIPLMILKSKNKIYLPDARYHYRQREGSIMAERRGEIDSLFNAYRMLLLKYDEIMDNKIYQDLIFILLRDWLINIRVAYREKKYQKSISLLNEGIRFFNHNNSSWIKNEYLIKHLTSKHWWSKLKIKFILNLIDKNIFRVFFLLHINYCVINWKNVNFLINAQKNLF